MDQSKDNGLNLYFWVNFVLEQKNGTNVDLCTFLALLLTVQYMSLCPDVYVRLQAVLCLLLYSFLFLSIAHIDNQNKHPKEIKFAVNRRGISVNTKSIKCIPFGTTASITPSFNTNG